MYNREKFFAKFRTFYKASTGKTKVSQKVVDNVNYLLDSFYNDAKWKDLRHVAYALATISRETGFTYAPVTEYGSKSYFNKYEGRKDLGNTQTGDGYKFRGRGYVQITGRKNYSKFSGILNKDLIRNPELTLEADTAFDIMTYGMFNGSFTGRKITDYINSKETDYTNSRRVINGLDKAKLIAGYARSFENILKASLQEEDFKPLVDRTSSVEPSYGEELPDNLGGEEVIEEPVDDYPEDPKPGEAAPEQPAKEGEPVVGGRPGDPPKEIPEIPPTETSGWGAWLANVRAQWASLGIGGLSLGSLGFLQNPTFIYVALGLLGTAVVVSVTVYLTSIFIKSKEKMAREAMSHELTLRQLELTADPTKYNVKLVKLPKEEHPQVGILSRLVGK